MKKEVVLLVSLVIFVSLLGVVYAEAEEENILDDEEFSDSDLQANAGTKPGSVFYAIDKFFDRFSDEGKVRQERIAEFREMIAQGKYEEARIAIEDYSRHASEFEKEVDPSKREEARRSAAAIKNVLEELKDEIPEDIKEEYYDKILEKEESIATAVEIASKIKDLCEQLSELDPNMFYESCKVGDEGPKWQKEMYKDLTDDQEKEARKFAEVMKNCFKNSGQNCACDEIPFPDFANTCSIAAPLAISCEIDGDETACEELDNLEMPELPPHLQDVMDDLEEGMMHEKFDMHMPPECEEAGANNPKDCSKIMIKVHAPEECREALLEADVQSERESREICERIMMEKDMPECVEEGITDPEECKDFMWNIDKRPPECVDNQIHDFRDCKKFLAEGGTFRPDEGPRINFDCKSIEDPMERLDCFDGATSGFGDYEDNYRETKEREKQCADKCHSEGRPWDFTGGECSCGEPGQHADGYGGFKGPTCGDCEQECGTKEGERLTRTDCGPSGCECYWEEDDSSEDSWQGYDCAVLDCQQGYHCEPDFGCVNDDGEENYEESECKDGCSDECPGASRTDCVDGGTRCECYYEDDSESEQSDDQTEDEGETNTEQESSEGEGEEENSESDSSDSNSDDSSSEESSEDSGGEEGDSGAEDTSSDSGEEDNSGSGITGGVVDSGEAEESVIINFFKKLFGF